MIRLDHFHSILGKWTTSASMHDGAAWRHNTSLEWTLD